MSELYIVNLLKVDRKETFFFILWILTFPPNQTKMK